MCFILQGPGFVPVKGAAQSGGVYSAAIGGKHRTGVRVCVRVRVCACVLVCWNGTAERVGFGPACPTGTRWGYVTLPWTGHGT